jgi:hypothetical protein
MKACLGKSAGQSCTIVGRDCADPLQTSCTKLPGFCQKPRQPGVVKMFCRHDPGFKAPGGR